MWNVKHVFVSRLLVLVHSFCKSGVIDFKYLKSITLILPTFCFVLVFSGNLENGDFVDTHVTEIFQVFIAVFPPDDLV